MSARLDISTPELLDAAISRAGLSAAGLRALLFALGACQRRLDFKGKTLPQAWLEADSSSLQWFVRTLADRRGCGGGVRATLAQLMEDVVAAIPHQTAQRSIKQRREQAIRGLIHRYFYCNGTRRLDRR